MTGTLRIAHHDAQDPHALVGLNPRLVYRRKAVRHYLMSLMTARGWNITRLAQEADCSLSYASRIISGDRTPSLSTTVHLARVLDVPLADLAEALL